MTNLDAEILRRNAYLRAWAACGVPVKGGWERLPMVDESYVELRLRCVDCGHKISAGSWPPEPDLARVERTALSGRATNREPLCPHLAPLLGPVPEEVEQVAALELLAGDAP